MASSLLAAAGLGRWPTAAYQSVRRQQQQLREDGGSSSGLGGDHWLDPGAHHRPAKPNQSCSKSRALDESTKLNSQYPIVGQ